MEFIANITKDEYESFVISNELKSHFLQSSLWGELKGNYFLVGLKDNNKLVAATMLLKKNIFLKYSYFYAPRGFVIDFNNLELVNVFVDNIKKFVKMNHGIFFKIDPDLILNVKDDKGNIIITNKENELVINNLKEIGFKHRGFNLYFEGSQPRFTFRINMDDKVYDRFSTTTKQRIKKANDLGVIVENNNPNAVKIFSNLMKETEDRKNFYQHDSNYYEKMFDILKPNNIKIFLGKVTLSTVLENLKLKRNNLELEITNLKIKEETSKIVNQIKSLEEQLSKLNGDITKYEIEFPKYSDELYLSAHVIIYYGNKAWVLYAGNSELFPEFYTNYLVYNEHIKYAKDLGIKIYDQFGTIGKLDPTNHLYGLHEFKRKFGGDYVEFIGEFDYVLNPFLYFIYNRLIPIYRNLRKRIQKKSR